MNPISSMAPRPVTAPGIQAAEPSREARSASPASSRSLKPVRDEYVPEEKRPESRGRKAERCTGNTDAVDREIKKLREKREKLEKQLSSETDEAKRAELERKLSQVESELRQKDNDAYRRQHSTFTEG